MAQVYNKIFDPDKWEKVNKENKDILDDFILEIKSRKLKESTLKQYYNDGRIVMLYVYETCDNKNITELTKRDFRRFLLWLTEDLEVSNARANRIMSCLRTMLNFLEDDDEEYADYDRNPTQKIKGLGKEPVREIIFLEDNVIMQLREKFKKEERWRDYLLISFLYESGARKNEIAQVRRDSILPDKNSTNVVVAKRGKKYPLLYYNMVKEAFKYYDEWRGEDNIESLWIVGHDKTARPASTAIIYEWVTNWRKDLKEITGEDIALNVHTFRHCFIENCSNGTHSSLSIEMGLGKIPIEKIKVLVRHSDVSTTDHYRQNNEDKELEDLLGIEL